MKYPNVLQILNHGCDTLVEVIVWGKNQRHALGALLVRLLSPPYEASKLPLQKSATLFAPTGKNTNHGSPSRRDPSSRHAKAGAVMSSTNLLLRAGAQVSILDNVTILIALRLDESGKPLD
jgi:hypothetical protein